VKKGELFNLFRDFSKGDFLEFKKYLDSSHLLNKKSLLNIFKIIRNSTELLNNLKFDKLLKKISIKLNYSSTTINHRLSSLNKSILNFFKVKSLLSDEENAELSLNKYLLRNEYFSILRTNLEKTDNLINNTKYFSDNYFWYSFNYNVLHCDFLTNFTRFVNNKSSDRRFYYMNEASTDLSLFNLIQQINLFANTILLNTDIGSNDKIEFPIDILKMIQEFDSNNLFNKLVKKKNIYELYKSMFFAFYRREDSEYFIKYKQCFDEILHSLNKELIKFHYNILINYCVMKEKLAEEKEFYRKQQVEILLDYIDKGHFKTNDDEHLHSIEYRNFILIAFSIKDYGLIKYFIDNCTSKLNEKDYKDMMNLGLAFYYYGTKNYEKTLECINNIEINNFIYRFDIRSILLQLYYETEEIDKLMDLIHNYKKIISYDKTLNKFNKDSKLKLLKYLNKLIIIRNNPNINHQKEAKFLINQVQNEPAFAQKKWLLERLGELSKTTKEKETSIAIPI
jgi:hypothetical protein